MADNDSLDEALARIIEQQEAEMKRLKERTDSASSLTDTQQLTNAQQELEACQAKLKKLTEVRTELEAAALKKSATSANDRLQIEKEITQTQQQREQASVSSSTPPAAPPKSGPPSTPPIEPLSNEPAKLAGSEENEDSEKRKAIKKAKEERRKFEGDGLPSIQRQRAAAAGRYREAFNIDLGRAAGARYEEIHQKGGSAEEAMEAAQLTLREKQMDVRRGLSSLGRAQDSRGNLAALQSLAGGLSTEGATEYLRQIVKSVETSRQDRQAESAMQTHR